MIIFLVKIKCHLGEVYPEFIKPCSDNRAFFVLNMVPETIVFGIFFMEGISMVKNVKTAVRPVVHFIADGEVTEFFYNFLTFGEDDLDVYIGEELQNANYTVVSNNENGGKVVFDQPPKEGAAVTIIRNLEIKRTSDFQESGAFRAKVINHELDYQVASIQQLDEKISRTIMVPPYSTNPVKGALPLPQPGKAIVWNPAGDELINSDLPIDTAFRDIALSLDEAKTYAGEAEAEANRAAEQAAAAAESALIAEEAITYVGTHKFATAQILSFDFPVNISGLAPLNDWQNHPNGYLIENCETGYPQFWEMMSANKAAASENPQFERFGKTQEDYDAEMQEKGFCGFYIIDEEAGSVRLPYLGKTFSEAAFDANIDFEPALPNIHGSFVPSKISGYNPCVRNGIGAFETEKGSSYQSEGLNPASAQMSRTVTFNASWSNPIYRDGATVQPAANTKYYYIVLANSVIPVSVQEASALMGLVETKAGKDLDNLSSRAKSRVSGLASIGKTADELTLGAAKRFYTAPAAGTYALCKSFSGSGKQFASLIRVRETGNSQISNQINSQHGYADSSGQFVSLSLHVNKGDIICVDYNLAGAVNWFRFIYDEGEE